MSANYYDLTISNYKWWLQLTIPRDALGVANNPNPWTEKNIHASNAPLLSIYLVHLCQMFYGCNTLSVRCHTYFFQGVTPGVNNSR